MYIIQMFRMTLLSCMISSDLESEHHTINVWYDSFLLLSCMGYLNLESIHCIKHYINVLDVTTFVVHGILKLVNFNMEIIQCERKTLHKFFGHN